MSDTKPSVLIQPYLFFSGHCDEAIQFYGQALGAATTVLMRFQEGPPNPHLPANWGEKVMHATLQIGEATLMLSDGMGPGDPNFQGFSVSLTVADTATAKTRFTALAEGGKVTMPLASTFWSPLFGMVSDRFGVNWMVSAAS